MPYNLKHLVHMPNTKQSEIHNSLAAALFALFNSFFAFSNQCVDALFLQSTLEKKEVLKYLSEAVLFVPVWALWCPGRRVGVDCPDPDIPPNPACSWWIRMVLSESWHFTVHPPILAGLSFWNHIKADFHLEHFSQISSPLTALNCSGRKQLLEQRPCKPCCWGCKYWREGRQKGVS